MNKRRLSKLAKWLEDGAKHARVVFDMTSGISFRIEAADFDPSMATSCGAACCIAGAAVQFFGNVEGMVELTLELDGEYYFDSNSEIPWSDVSSTARELLGLSDDQALRLFKPSDNRHEFGWETIKVVHAPHAGTRSKNKKDRILPMTARAKALLMERWGHVKGGPFHDLNQSRLNDHWSGARAACGITDPDCVPYAQRHTVATKIGESTGDLNLIKEWLGHSSIDITAKTYLHTTQRHMAKGALALEKRRADDEEYALNRDRDIPETGMSPSTTLVKPN